MPERLIEQTNLRLPQQASAQGDALLLPAGKLLDGAIQVFFEIEHAGDFEQFAGTIAVAEKMGPGGTQVPRPAQILPHGALRHQGRALEHHGDAAAMARRPIDGLPADANFAFARFVQPGDESQQCRLAAAGRAHEREALAGPGGERDLIEHLDRRCESFADLFKLQFDGHVDSPRQSKGMTEGAALCHAENDFPFTTREARRARFAPTRATAQIPPAHRTPAARAGRTPWPCCGCGPRHAARTRVCR